MLQASHADKSCRVCGGSFLPFTSTQVVCGLRCAQRIPVIARNTQKAERKATREKLVALKPRSHWLKEAQTAVNAWIRWRDRELPCISCGRFHQGSYDAGHYLSVGARPELRYDEANIHRQCVPCNQHLHGNIALFRMALIGRIGAAELERLEGPQEPKKYTVDELRQIINHYRARLRRDKAAA